MDFWNALGFGLTHIFSTCGFVLFIVYLNKAIRLKKRVHEYLPFVGLTLLFICTGISYLLAVWADYYRWEYGIIVIELYVISFSAMYASFAALTYLFEFMFKKTKFIITGYLIACAVIVNFWRDLEILNSFTLYTSIPMFLIIPLFLYYTFIKPTSGILRQRVLFGTLGIIMVGIGIFFRFSFLSETLGEYIYSVGTLFAIIGVCLFGYGFSAFSTFTDLNWKKKLYELYVVAPNGACVFAYSFSQSRSLKDSDLIAGGFSGIQSLLSEMMQTNETLQLIDYQNMKIMLEQVKGYMFILISKEESWFIRYKLRLFTEEFNAFFKDILEIWDHRTDVFKPTSTLIEKIFEGT
jgi:hypothetical protein